MKQREEIPVAQTKRRAPHGARGLKRRHCLNLRKAIPSRPAWGAWIETLSLGAVTAAAGVAPRMGRVD